MLGGHFMVDSSLAIKPLVSTADGQCWIWDLNMSTPAPPVPHFFAHKRLSSRLLCLSPQPRQDPFLLLQWNHAPKTTGWSSMTNTFQPTKDPRTNTHTHTHTHENSETWQHDATWCTTSTVPGVGSLVKGLYKLFHLFHFVGERFNRSRFSDGTNV